jgi:hypothetical protein
MLLLGYTLTSPSLPTTFLITIHEPKYSIQTNKPSLRTTTHSFQFARIPLTKAFSRTHCRKRSSPRIDKQKSSESFSLLRKNVKNVKNHIILLFVDLVDHAPLASLLAFPTTVANPYRWVLFLFLIPTGGLFIHLLTTSFDTRRCFSQYVLRSLSSLNR